MLFHLHNLVHRPTAYKKTQSNVDGITSKKLNKL